MLTEREREVAESVAAGLSNQQIADSLYMRLSTVRVTFRGSSPSSAWLTGCSLPSSSTDSSAQVRVQRSSAEPNRSAGDSGCGAAARCTVTNSRSR
ncbi:MAG: hypothetical protein CSA58_09495 [Micrococcales bacterium]|nr:MAG: hypothetical protein CSB46_05110 [Micrococcales bacterium]PIE26419.1 MAG: hypothetical protein CSA58_09495 [Micrococcales bacterium]